MNPDQIARGSARMMAERRAFAADPWWAIERGYVLTQDEKPGEGEAAVRPLSPDPYLHEMLLTMRANRRGLMGKSRQMKMSWLFTWFLAWDAITQPARLNIFQGKRQDDVSARGWKGLLGRARFMRQHLPPWLQPDVLKEDTLIETYANGSALEALPEGEDIVRSRVPSRMFLDEICFQESGEKNWNAANPAADWMWGVSTPNGHEFKYRQADPGRRWDDWRTWPLLNPDVPALHGYLSKRGVMLVFLHYTADPDERTPEAQAKRRSGYTTERDMLREQEGNYSLPTGLPVWGNEFDRRTHVIERYNPDIKLPLYRGWDFGYTGQACGFYQITQDGQIVWFDLVFAKMVALQRIAQEVLKRSAIYAGRQPTIAKLDGSTWNVQPDWNDWGDPSADAHHTDGETDTAILSRFGITLRTVATSGKKTDLVDNVRTHLLNRADGKPGLILAMNSAEMEHAVAAMEGGYRYEEPKEGKAEKAVPFKDGFSDHIADQLQYFVAGIRPPRSGRVTTAKKDWWKDPVLGVGQE